MRTFTRVVAHVSDTGISEAIARLDARGQLHRLSVSAAEFGRRRFRALDQHGTEFGVALARHDDLRDGAVLHLDEDTAVVIQATRPPRLVIRAVTLAGALQLGWSAGHLHWKVRMDDAQLSVLLEDPREEYLRRIEPLIRAGLVELRDQASGE